MATEKPYDGYVALTKKGKVAHDGTQADRARGAKAFFDADHEGMQTVYKTYKKKDDPAPKELSNRLGAASEDAVKRMQRTHRDGDSEKLRESRRGQDQKPSASRSAYNSDTSAVNKKGNRYAK